MDLFGFQNKHFLAKWLSQVKHRHIHRCSVNTVHLACQLANYPPHSHLQKFWPLYHDSTISRRNCSSSWAIHDTQLPTNRKRFQSSLIHQAKYCACTECVQLELLLLTLSNSMVWIKYARNWVSFAFILDSNGSAECVYGMPIRPSLLHIIVIC